MSADAERFDAAAVRLAGLAGVTFGWRPRDFWSATPDDLATLVRALLPDTPSPPDQAMIARLQEAFPDG